MEMYEKIRLLCERDGIRFSSLALETGLRSSVFTELKMGRTRSLSVVTLKKIADYFDVPLDYFVSPKESETPIAAKRRVLADTALMLDEAELDSLISMAKLLAVKATK